MKTQRQWCAPVLAAMAILGSAAAVHAGPANAYPVAGFAPSQRPVNAPVLKTTSVSNAGKALHGVSSPIPESLKFLDHQGNWYTPYTHPGMPGPYDLRGWHVAPLPAADKK